MRIRSIAGRELTADEPYIIAEAGVNHEGELDRAFELIDAAADAGADMIKFQSYKAETLASRHSPAYWDQNEEPADSQFALFKRYDAFEPEDYRRMAERCQAKGIAFSSTPFDARFVDVLAELVPVYKIASADITNEPLLRQVAGKGKPVLISTGAAYLSEIDRAVRTLAEAGAEEIGVLHCILEYPTRFDHAQLRALEHLAAAFPDVTLGWSDHVPPEDDCLSMLLAWMLGARVIEKHFTLDKTLPGNDHYHAMDPDDLQAFRKRQSLAQAMLGEREKTVMPWEEPARLHARRSLVAARPIPAGTPITEEMVIPKRPAHGIAPEFLPLLLGAAPTRDIEEDQILSWDLFMVRPGG